jgi:hypothetical protein
MRLRQDLYDQAVDRFIAKRHAFVWMRLNVYLEAVMDVRIELVCMFTVAQADSFSKRGLD